MQMKPEMRVNYVRVYQNPNDPTQKVGCSTPERPTRQYIEAHQELYKQATDVSFSNKQNDLFVSCGVVRGHVHTWIVNS